VQESRRVDSVQKGLVQEFGNHYSVSTMQREEIAFFDVDHTISRRATALAFILVCMRHGLIKVWYLLGVPFSVRFLPRFQAKNGISV
jgi:hypothetical protein